MGIACHVEIEWSAGIWTDETAHVRRVQTWAGFAERDAPVADVGRCRIELDNSTKRFSPGYTGGALYGSLVPRKQIRVSSGATVIWRGYIDRLIPSAGTLGDRLTILECVDGIAILAGQRIGVEYSGSRDVVDALDDLVSAAYTPPATDYADAGEVLTYYGRTWQPEKTSCLDGVRDVCNAFYGRFFAARDGTLTYIDRSARQNPSVASSLSVSDSDALTGLGVVVDVARIVNRVQVIVYPVETVGSLSVLWKASTNVRVQPGQTRELYAPFRDEFERRCGAVDLAAATATTDYKAYSNGSGSGPDMTAYVTVNTEDEATRRKFTISHSLGCTLYLTLLQVRGKPLITYDPIIIEDEDAASVAAYQPRAQVFDLPMNDDSVYGETLAEYLLGRFGDPILEADSLTVVDRQTINGVEIFALDLLDKVTISDTQTGAASLAHWIRSIEYDLHLAGFRAAFHLERADDRKYLILDKVGYGELDSNRLGF